VARVALIAAVVAVSTSAPLVRLAESAPALTFASLRVTIAATILLALAPGALIRYLGLPSRDRWLIAAAGALLGAHFGIWIGSLHFTSTASSVTLVSLQPAFAALLGRALLGDAVGRRAWLGIGVAVAGTAVLAGGDLRASGLALLGDAMALAGAAAAAAYLVVGRSLRASLPLVPYLAVVNVFAAAVLVPTALVVGVPLAGFELRIYAAIAACAAVGSVLGHSLINWSVRRTPTHLVTLAILGEPVGATLLSWALVGEVPPTAAALGGPLVLAGIYLGFSSR
jgi:drug/metabolite transporter (DMT)-like permease